jgi:hypothetical protein
MFGFLQRECTLCLGPHDEEIHAATTRVRAWLRSEMARRLGAPDQTDPLAGEPPEPDRAA